MKKLITIIAILFSLNGVSQTITDTSALRSYINAVIIPNGAKAITGAQMNLVFNGILNSWVPLWKQRVDSIWKSGNVFYYRKGGVTWNFLFPTGGGDSTLFATQYRVDTAKTNIRGQVPGLARAALSFSFTTSGTSGAATGNYNPLTGAFSFNVPQYQAAGSYEPSISAGTTAQYWRGDKTWRDFNTDARAAISLTTTGTSGAATYTGGVLNIPNYTGTSDWALAGNTTSSPNNYLGTLNSTSVRIGVNNTDELTVSSSAVTIPTNTVTIGSTSVATSLSLASTGGAGNGIELNVPTGNTYATVDFKNNGTLNGQFASTSTTFSNGAFGSNSVALTSLNNNGELVLGGSGTSGRIVLLTGGTATTNRRMIIEAGGAVGINTNAVNGTALLEMASNSKGFLPPRMTTSDRNTNIPSPATGLMIFCTDCTANDGSTGVSQTYSSGAWRNHY